MNSDHFGPVAPNKTLTLHRVLDTPGVFMYHCAAGPVTDLHIKSGLAGAMIVYPRSETLRPAKELVIVQSAIYGDRDASGECPAVADAQEVRRQDHQAEIFRRPEPECGPRKKRSKKHQAYNAYSASDKRTKGGYSKGRTGTALARHLVTVQAGYDRRGLAWDIDKDRSCGAAVLSPVIDSRKHDDGGNSGGPESGRQENSHCTRRSYPW